MSAHRAFLAQRRLPTLVLWGAQDRIVPADYLEAIRQVGAVEEHRLDCGHYPQLEVPGELCEVVLRFLDGEEGARASA